MAKKKKKASQFRCEAVCLYYCWPVANGPPETLLPPKTRSETKTKSPRTFCLKIWNYCCWAQLMEMCWCELGFLLLSFEPSDCSQAFWLGSRHTVAKSYFWFLVNFSFLFTFSAVCLCIQLFVKFFVYNVSCLFTMSAVCLQYQLFACKFSFWFRISAFCLQWFLKKCIFCHSVWLCTARPLILLPASPGASFQAIVPMSEKI